MAKHILWALSFAAILSLQGASAQVTDNCPYSPRHRLDLACLIPDVSATGNTNLGTFNTTLAQVLSQLPVAVPVSGFALTLDRTLGIYVVPEDSLGSVLTERGDTVGRHKLFLAFTYQHFNFDEIDGTSLNNLPTVWLASYNPATPGLSVYGYQKNSVSAKIDQFTAIAAFGLTDRFDISMILPSERVELGATAFGAVQYSGGSAGQQLGSARDIGPVSGSASGPGDLVVNGKFAFYKGEKARLAGGLEVRFPTGDEYNLLGSGAYGFKPYVVFSRRGRITPHANLGYQWNSQSVLFPNPSGSGNLRMPDTLEYSFGADARVVKRLTVVGDFLGTHFFKAPRLTAAVPASQSVPAIPGLPDILKDTPTVGVNPEASFDENNLAIGIKVNPVGRLLLTGNVLIKLNDAGLRANYVPMVGISYKF